MKGTYKIREYFDKYVLYGTGETSWNPTAMMILNEVGYTIFTLLEKDKSIEDIVEHLTDEYEVSGDTALKDTRDFIEILRRKNIY